MIATFLQSSLGDESAVASFFGTVPKLQNFVSRRGQL